MTIRKVIASDENTIIELFKKFDDTPVNHDDKRVLFKKQFNCDEDFYGLLIEDQGKVIAYLGLIFVHRQINNQLVKYCNLTSFLIDPDYRGQKLTHKMIDEVLKLGNYTVTAITPIPSLYRMYESKGLVKLSDYRIIFWRTNINFGYWKVVKEIKYLEKLLNKNDFQIYVDHLKFNCICMVITNGYENLLIVGKKNKAQKRKFKTGRIINYIDFFLRNLLGKSILDKTVETIDISYCSNYHILTNPLNFPEILSIISDTYSLDGLVLREDIIDLSKLKNFKQNRFWKSRQLFLSNKLQPKHYDTLYSEIFVLNLE